MSLVVARIVNDTAFIFSDTKFTISPDRMNLLEKEYPNLINSDYATIKTIIFNDQISISWAGELIYAMNAIKNLEGNNNVDDVINLLTEANRKSNNETEFIVSCKNYNKVRLYEIKNFTRKERQTCYIGNNDAFNKYQQYYHILKDTINDTRFSIVRYPDNLCENAKKEFSRMFDAFYNVIEDSTKETNTVGGFPVSVAYENEKFSYIDYVKNIRPSLLPNEIIPGATISLGDASLGAYGINFFGSKKVVGLYIYQANLGISYTMDNGFMKSTYWRRISEQNFKDKLSQIDYDLNSSITCN